MPAPFRKITREEFASVLAQFPFTRHVTGVHMHHTFIPDHAQYRGHDSIVAMWRYHTVEKGWRDIAQHITISPDGAIWLGRNWNWPPASAAGFNGNDAAGPFMFEMIGNFDVGRDVFGGEQRRTALEVIARVQKRFGLAPGTLAFHNTMSSKSCPGSAVDYDDVLSEVTALHGTLGASRSLQALPDNAPFGADALETAEANDAVRAAIASLRASTSRGFEADGELDHDDAEAFASAGDAAGARDSELTPAMLEGLRPHLVNLAMGQFSSEGEWKTTSGDVDAIFDEHLPAALGRESHGQPLRIVFYAHGGLVKESLGLQIAQKHKEWWLRNGVYPINFVWETGAFETIGQLLRRASEGMRAGARDVFDFTTDPVVEEIVRALQGPSIWSAMKRSAELASATGDEEGGARYVARKLAEFCRKNPNRVELHAVGHSAGSIFHSYFLPAALAEGSAPFRTMHLLAPAVRTDTFKRELAGHLGSGVERTTIFTMGKSYERADDCARIYRKSLLYLIYHALEAGRKTPILGLEESLRDDAELKRLFGLGHSGAPGEVVWSVTALDKGRSASTSTTHGGFDDDAPTLNSVVRRILGKQDADPVHEYVPGALGRSLDPWSDQVDWPEGIVLRKPQASAPPMPATMPKETPLRSEPVAGGGRRRALCVGINRYPTAPLNGCVADAEQWAQALRNLGFEEPAMLLDERATRAAIVAGLKALVADSRAGDVIVFQYAGHGTTVDDLNGDEAGGDTPGKDEALCPVDFASGAFFIDDDIGEICDGLPAGVNLTCFFDCCHSGTISRMAVGAAPDATPLGADPRPRFIQTSSEMERAHRRLREQIGGSRATGSGGPSLMKEVVFSACLSSEVAWESGGHGEFTVRAMQVFASSVGGFRNEQFAEQVTAKFGASPRQHAGLYCAPEAKGSHFLQAAAGGRGMSTASQPGLTQADARSLLQAVCALAAHIK